jgi:hypothetical protein
VIDAIAVGVEGIVVGADVSVAVGAKGAAVAISNVEAWIGDGETPGVSPDSAVAVGPGLHWLVRMAANSSPPKAKYFIHCAYLDSSMGGSGNSL